MTQVIEAELTWTGDRFARAVQVAVNEDGAIEGVGQLERETTLRLERQALLPGSVSAHSHAFQRGLRGRGDTFPAGAGTFWSWREAMYGLVGHLDESRFHTVVRDAFREMRAAGITTVGEFHYLHHSTDSSDFAFDEIVLRAARNAGIRVVLLMTYYKTGGIGKPLSAAQRRFQTDSLEQFWEQVDRLGERLDGPLQTIGVAAHSIRGVPIDDIQALYTESQRRKMPFHMHVEEQRKEIEDCIAAYGKTPMQLLNERLESCEGVTAVHATHTEAADMRRFLARGGSVCITPLTEANLGDGIPDLTALKAMPERLSLGSDSNARISMLEEMRWLEYAQRLKSETRGILRDDAGNSARLLLQCATFSGARALGVDTGRMAVGACADFVAVNMDAPSIAGVDEQYLLDAIIFGGSDEIVKATCVGGNWLEHR